MTASTVNEMTMDHWYCIYTKPSMEEQVSKRLLDVPEMTGIFIKDLPARDRVLILLNAISYQAGIEIEEGFLAIA
jgi:hypothetical protein